VAAFKWKKVLAVTVWLKKLLILDLVWCKSVNKMNLLWSEKVQIVPDDKVKYVDNLSAI
jgi:hypothetical protein